MLSSWPLLLVVLGLLDPIISAGPTRDTSTGARLAEPGSWDLDHSKSISPTTRGHHLNRFRNGPIEPVATLSPRHTMLETSVPNWRIIIHHWMAFGPSSNNTSTLSNMYTHVRSRINQKYGLSAPRKSVCFTYGSFTLTFQSRDKVILCESIDALIRTMATSLKRSGLAALYFVTFHLARGSIITVILGVGWHGIRAQLYPDDYIDVRTDWVKTGLIG